MDPRKIFTVSELTHDLKSILEDTFSFVWISGEISNYKLASSGHAYFTLKDDKAQISCVMFRPSLNKLKFKPEEGMQINLYGSVSVYEPRGQYQLIATQMEPEGLGALQLAFEQLKNKLASEGLFDQAKKRELPYLPQKIGIITSSQGAVVHDMMTVMRRRNPHVDLLIHPVKVQGEGAALEIAEAITVFNQRTDLDLIIVGRGGGSLEDLWAFNEEVLVRAVASSGLPIISAVGHEVDYTLCDMAADVRAPTPSVAGELAVPVYHELKEKLEEQMSSLYFAMRQQLKELNEAVVHAKEKLRDPRQIIYRWAQRIDELEGRLQQTMAGKLREARLKMGGLKNHLEALSPLKVLARGYSIVSSTQTQKAITDSQQVQSGDLLHIQTHQGIIKATVV